MSLSNKEKIELVNKIYQDFLARVRGIEAQRDERITALFNDDDQEKIAKILRDLSIKHE